MTSTLIGGGRQGKNEMLLDVGGLRGLRECSRRPVFIFLLKRIGFVLQQTSC